MQVSFFSRLSQARTDEERAWIVTENLLNSMPPELASMAWAAAVPSWFDDKVLAFLRPELQARAQDLYQQLQELSFVESFPGFGHSIHELTRNLMGVQMQKQNLNGLAQILDRAIEYFSQIYSETHRQEAWSELNKLRNLREYINTSKPIQLSEARQISREQKLAGLGERLGQLFIPENTDSSQELLQRIRAIVEADTDDFTELAKIAGLDLRLDFSGADLSHVDLSYADLKEANLSETNLSYANLRGADLRYTNLREANCSNSILSHANLRGANLTGADLSHANLQYTDLSSANCVNATLNETNLSHGFLSRTQFQSAHLIASCLAFAACVAVDFTHAVLSNADFSDSSLMQVDFRHAHLDGASFLSAVFDGCQFNNANLQRAAFELATITGVDFFGADLSGAHFRRATFDTCRLEGVLSVQGTKFYGNAGLSNELMRSLVRRGAIFQEV